MGHIDTYGLQAICVLGQIDPNGPKWNGFYGSIWPKMSVKKPILWVILTQNVLYAKFVMGHIDPHGGESVNSLCI